MKRGSTTALGIVMLALGALGLALASLSFLAFASGAVEPTALLVVDTILNIVSKIGLIACGALVLGRRTLALPLTVLTFCVSLAGSATSAIALSTMQTAPPDAPENVQAAHAAGQTAGFGCVVFLAIVLYVVAIVYLTRPATKAEFAGKAPREEAAFD